jgi:hypothetical protein
MLILSIIFGPHFQNFLRIPDPTMLLTVDLLLKEEFKLSMPPYFSMNNLSSEDVSVLLVLDLGLIFLI